MPTHVGPAEAIAEIVRVCARCPGQTVFIGIDGAGAAGKSTFAARAAAEVPRSALVHVDDFSGPNVREWDWTRFNHQVVEPLRADRAARYQRWDWADDSPAEWHDIAVGQVVIVEGVSATRREVVAPWALTVWMDAPRDVRLARAIERDGPAMLDRWLTDWMPSEEAYIAREHPQQRVDLIVAGTEPA